MTFHVNYFLTKPCLSYLPWLLSQIHGIRGETAYGSDLKQMSELPKTDA